MSKSAENPVSGADSKKRVYVINAVIQRGDVLKWEENRNWIDARATFPKCDKRRRSREKYLFERISLEQIGSNASIQICRLKGSNGPWYSPKKLCKQEAKKKKFTIYATFKMKPAIFDNEYNQLQKTIVNKKQKKATSTEEEEEEEEEESSILTENEDEDSSSDSDMSTTTNKNRLQRKNTLNKRKEKVLREKEPIPFERIENEISLIKPILSVHEKYDGDVAKAMRYITNFTGEYKKFGLEPHKYAFIRKQVTRVTQQNYSMNKRRNKRNYNNNKNKKSNNNHNNNKDEAEHDTDTENQCNHSDCEEFECKYKIKNIKKLSHKNQQFESDNSTYNDGDSDHKNWCHICKRIIASDIREHWKTHRYRNDTTYQCRHHKRNTNIPCLKSFANRFRLKSHIHSQHAKQLLKQNELHDDVRCPKCGSKTKPAYDGTSGEYKIGCTKCNIKRVPTTDIEVMRLNDTLLSETEIKTKYPLPTDSKDLKESNIDKNADKNMDKDVDNDIDNNTNLNNNKTLDQLDGDGATNNDNSSSKSCIDGIHDYQLQEQSGLKIWGCTRCGTIGRIFD